MKHYRPYVKPCKNLHLVGPKIQTSKEISIVIPVKKNQLGVECFLTDFLLTQNPEYFPLEIIFVRDEGDSIKIPSSQSNYPITVKLLSSKGKGPAMAKNVGWRNAEGGWILFTDSDCRPMPGWLKGFIQASNGSIGYTGEIRSFGHDLISQYYENQRSHMAPILKMGSVFSPSYLVTANAIVWKEALEKTGGFNEEINIAAAEDLDLSFRLRDVGNLAYAPKSLVLHDFHDSLLGFIKRYRRYGAGNRILIEIFGPKMNPPTRKPMKKTIVNYVLACIKSLSMLWGWYIDFLKL